MSYILAIFAIGVVCMIIFYYINSGDIDKKLNRRDKINQLISDNVLVNSKSFTNEESTKAIVLDEQNKKIHLFSLIENKILSYRFDDVIQSEVIIDNSTVITTNRGKQVLGGVVGGLIAGVPGMIIGGLSSGQKESENIKDVELKLTINDMSNPIFKINFLNPIAVNKGLSKDFYMIKNALTEVEKWQGYFDVILKQQNQVI